MSFLTKVELGREFQPFPIFEEDLGSVPNLLRAGARGGYNYSVERRRFGYHLAGE